MNKKWAELNKTLQSQLKKEETFADGVQTVLRLRQELFDVLCQLKSELTREEFNDSPYLNAEGYHSKTIAYAIWHIFRIEDIVAHLSGMMKNYLCQAISLTVSIVLS